MGKVNVTTKSPKGLCLWARQIASWAIDGLLGVFPYAFLFAALCASVFLPTFIFSCKETEVRLLGLLLQLIGFVLVLWQLNDRLKLFQKPSIVSRMREYWRRFPSNNNTNITLEGIGAAGFVTGHAEISVKFGSNATLEGRVETLEHAMKDAEEEIRTVKETVDRHKQDSKKSLEALRQENSLEFGEMKKLMDEAVVGNVHLEWVGIGYLLAGIVLATAAPEIANLGGYGISCDQ